MSDRNQVLSSHNLQTMVAVAFVLVLLSLGFNFYNFARMNQIMVGLLDVEGASIRANARSEEALQRQITELQNRLDEIQGATAAANTEAPKAPPAEEGKDAKAGTDAKAGKKP